jgi:CheY-like chemotaxis protein
VKGDRALVDPAKVVQEIKQLVVDTFPKSLNLELQVPEDLWAVTGDATQLHQVLLNLCVNARDAMPDGGRLAISLANVELDESYVSRNVEAKPGSYVLIKVMDDGLGIPKAIQSRIFEPFFTTKEQGKGTGLGLSTCFTIVKNHGGFINCYSEPGNGSAFKVYLPAEAGARPRAQKPTEAASLPKGRNELVLVVDDEQVIREFAQITLECFGYRTLTAADGAEAVSLYQIHQNEIAAVLMDMWMPVMDGPSAVKALKAIDSQVLIIGTSGLGSIGGEKVEKSLAHFITKPYTADTLLHSLDKALHPVVAGVMPAAGAPSPSSDRPVPVAAGH